MKRTLKRLLPIFLCLVLICSICWYFLSYDHELTQDILLGCAQLFEEHSNYSIATWFYNQAYLHSGNNDKVIIELAERYRQMGNYTQAEIALTKAIAENGTVDLYVALCNIYVEQDKLLDAAKMLDNIMDPDIKAQLDSMRPPQPVPSHAPNKYAQYITVELSTNCEGTLYVTTDGDFPSIKDVYSGGITLEGGETSIYAVTVGTNGLVSVPAYFGYTVGGVIEEVTISDPVLDKLYRELLNVDSDAVLFSDDLWGITSLTVPEGVTDYTQIGLLSYLEDLVMEDTQIENLQMLSDLTQLKSLTIRGSALSTDDLRIIGSLHNLEHLVLVRCSLSNISNLANATKLLTLDISENSVADLSPLSFLEHLTTLNVSNNAVTSTTPLSALGNLRELDISSNLVSSLMPLSICTKLEVLRASYNQLDHLTLFQNPEALVELDVSNNLLTNVDVLSAYTSLKRLTLSRNQLTDISALSDLVNLEYLDFSNNEVAKLPKFDPACLLITINGNYNKLTSVTELGGLPQLNWVFLDYNKISNLNPLADCYLLIQVDVFGNPISSISKLEAMDVIVNHDH